MDRSAYANPGDGWHGWRRLVSGRPSSEAYGIGTAKPQAYVIRALYLGTVQTKLRIERYATDSTAPLAVGRGP